MCASRQKSTTVTCNVASSLATTSPTGERLVNRFPMMIVIVDNKKIARWLRRAIGVSMRSVRYLTPQYILYGVYLTESFKGEILLIHNHIVFSFGS